MTFPFFVCAVSEKTIQSAPQPFNPQFRPFTANHLAKPHFHAILPRVCQAPSSPASCRAPICASCQSLALPLSMDWRTPSPPFYPAPQRGLRGLCLSHWPELANRSELFNSSSVIVPSPFAHSIEDPDPVGTVDCQPPLRRSPTFTNHCPPLP